jgi:hypothetical protein
LFSLELAVTSQATAFPLPWLAQVLVDSDYAVEYIGLATVEGQAAHHVRFWKVFGDRPKLRGLAEFSRKDIWIGAQSGLPIKLAYERRTRRGSVAIPIEVLYSDYRPVSGILYPFSIRSAHNGTPYATISIENVALNSGINEAEFQLLKRRVQ